jgi:DNA-binding helix-hairpin-helix protein with protein kinase domain
LTEKNNTYQYQLKRWNDEASPTKFNKIKSEIEMLVKKYQKIPNDYQDEKTRLFNQREFHQLQNFLSRFPLRNYSIPHIKEARKITLRSFGIETAADISGMNVPGFGPFLVGELTVWRKSFEKKFKFDPSLDIDPEHLNILNQKFSKTKSDYERQLVGSVEELRQIRTRVMAARNNLRGVVTQAARDYYQAEINIKDLFH